jgi:transposase|tara:strand:+ start:80 stop:367 length:288 start_codon:yes stop_codon:yes gene_type:complete
MGKIRRKHSSSFKLKVALEAIKGHFTMSEIMQKHSLHASRIHEWKKRLLAEGQKIFDSPNVKAQPDSKQAEIDLLHQKIGQLIIERDFLKKKLDV